MCQFLNQVSPPCFPSVRELTDVSGSIECLSLTQPASVSDSPNMLLSWSLVAAVVQLASAQSFSLINNYEGSSFFSGFKYNISVDNTTWGNVKYARGHMMRWYFD